MTERLADHTTLRVGGPAARFVRCRTEAQVVEAVLASDAAGIPVLVLGGGSNLLVCDEGFDGTVVHAGARGFSVVAGTDSVVVTAACGEPWDAVVAQVVGTGWSGIEALSYIPGLVGATPVQNVGAYGQDVAQTIAGVRVLDRGERAVVDLTPAQCQFGYRDSVFKHEPHRWVVLQVSYRLSRDPWSVVRYQQLAESLGIEVGQTATSAAVRDAVGQLRRSKGMVLDAADADTHSAGSFFTNPVVGRQVADRLPPECPRYPAADGVKVSAAWLIEHAGVTRGWHLHRADGARVSTKHTLALTNAGTATAAELLELARAIRDRVHERFAIELLPEPTLVGCSL